MAAPKFETTEQVRQAGTVMAVSPADIVIHEDLRGRHKAPPHEDVVGHAMSIFDVGQIQPVEARKGPDGKLVLTLGFTRHEAVQMIRRGFTGTDGQERHDPNWMLKVLVVPTNDQHAFMRNVIENCHRNQTTPIDDAYNQDRLRTRYGHSDADIARLYGYPSQNKVARLKRLLEIPQEIQDLVHDDLLPVDGALALMELPEDKRAEALEAAKRDSGRYNAQVIKAQVREATLEANEANGEANETEANDSGDGGGNEAETPKASRSAPSGRSIKEIRKFFTSLKEAEENVDPAVKRFATDLLGWINGKKSDKSMLNALDRILIANPTNVEEADEDTDEEEGE